MDRTYPLDLEGYLAGRDPLGGLGTPPGSSDTPSSTPATEDPKAGPEKAQSLYTPEKQRLIDLVNRMTTEQKISMVFTLLQDAQRDQANLEFPNEVAKFRTIEDVAALAKASPKWLDVLEITRRKNETNASATQRILKAAEAVFPPAGVQKEAAAPVPAATSPLFIIGAALLLLLLLKRKRD